MYVLLRESEAFRVQICDVIPDGKRGRGCRRGRIEHVDAAVGRFDAEVVARVPV